MRRLRAWASRLWGVFGGRRREQDLADELESHLQLHIDDNIRQGMTPDAVDEMLIQHLLTERLFRRIFHDDEFTRRNVIAAEVEKVIDALVSKSFSGRSSSSRSKSSTKPSVVTSIVTVLVFTPKGLYSTAQGREALRAHPG